MPEYGAFMWEPRHYAEQEKWDGIEGCERRVAELHAMWLKRSRWTRVTCRVMGHDYHRAPLFHYICGRCGYDSNPNIRPEWQS